MRQHASHDALCIDLSASLLPVLPQVLQWLRQLSDTDVRADLIAAHLGRSPWLAGLGIERKRRRQDARLQDGSNDFGLRDGGDDLHASPARRAVAQVDGVYPR